jgi:PAS domain S-box-containing protein
MAAGSVGQPHLADLDALLGAAPDAMVVIDAHGVITRANLRCAQMLGYTTDELVGQPVEVLVPAGLRDAHREHRTVFAQTPHVRDMGRGLRLAARRKDGTEVPVEISLGPFDSDDGPMVLASLRDVTRARHDERLFRSLLESAPDAIVVVDAAGRMILVNAQVEALFGHERVELIGRHVELLVPERFVGMHETFREGYVAGSVPRPIGLAGGLYGLRKDGTEFPVEISLSPLETEDGLVVLAAVRDISERLHVASAIREADELRRVQAETDRVKDEFFATVSHELRTPLTSMLGYTELITDFEELSPRCEHFLSIITRNAQRELRLVDDLLTLVSVKGSGLTVNLAKVDLGPVVRHAVEAMGPQAEEVGVAFGMDIPPSAVVVECDDGRVGQALDNLLSNALKFTPEGGHVIVRLYATETHACVEVADTGIGIGDDQPERVFERLYRSESAMIREIPGAGLGLSIASAIIEAHHGKIRVLSSDDSGSTFGIEIPLAASARELKES